MRFIIFNLFILISSIIHSQQNIFVGSNIGSNLITYEKATIYLNCKTGKDSTASGTGILFENDSKFYIVTAAHVAKLMGNNSYFVCVDSVYKPHTFSLRKNSISNIINWNFHKNADMAVMEIKPKNRDKYLKLHLDKWSLNFSMVDTNLTLYKRLNKVICFGFPLIDLNKTNYAPESIITYFVTNGSKLLKWGDNKKKISYFYLLQLPSIDGFSGGPVFEGGAIGVSNVTNNLRIKCIGIIHGTFYDKTGGKICYVTPCYYLKDLIK